MYLICSDENLDFKFLCKKRFQISPTHLLIMLLTLHCVYGSSCRFRLML